MKNVYKLSALISIPVLLFFFQNFTTVPVNQTEKFKIIWHIGTAVESLADAPDRRIEHLREIKSNVDGYYFLVVNNGSLLTYWPKRPQECLINFKSLRWRNEDSADGDVKLKINGKLYGKETQDRCSAELLKYYEELYRNAKTKMTFKQFQISLHDEALKRVLQNLDIKNEQAAGKKIMAEMLIRGGEKGDFFYNHKADKIKLVERDGAVSLPKTYSFLVENGIHPDRMMTYQEPHVQSENGSLIRVPLSPNGPTEYEPGVKACDFCLPLNIRVIDMVADAFKRAKLKAPRMAVNIRTWSESYEQNYPDHIKYPTKFDGINVEGSGGKIEKASYERSLDGVVWMLLNTKRPISFLIPGHLDLEDLNSENVRDQKYLENFLGYVRKLNADLNVKLKLPRGEHAICNSRISIIVGSYGAPLHMETLPLFRHDSSGKKTHRAGTVSAKIMALSGMRERLCR